MTTPLSHRTPSSTSTLAAPPRTSAPPLLGLPGNLAVSRVHHKRASFINSSSTRQLQLNAAAFNAQTYAANSYSYISGISSGTPRNATWFGAYTIFRKSIVQSHYQLISSCQDSSFTYDCTCADASVCAHIFQS